MRERNVAFIVSILFLCLIGCGHTDPNPGSIAFSVVWQAAPTQAAAVHSDLSAPDSALPAAAAQLDCAASGISTVSALAYSASNALLASGGPWNCSDHSGTINNISAQSNVSVVIIGKDSSGNGLYRGELPGITITAGQEASAGTVTATLFEPTFTAPANGSTVTNGFSLSWTSTGASYKIQVSSNNGFASTVIDAPVSATLYTPGISLNAGTYYCRVKSIDSYGNESGWSSVWSFTVPVAAAPSAPTGVTASPGINQNTISWNPVTGATSYNLYWSLSSGVTTTKGTKISGVPNPYPHTGLTNLTAYYYIVTAVNANGESTASAVVSTVPGSNLWIWTSGSNTHNQAGSYGYGGWPTPSNVPGARSSAVSGIDSKNNLWLFGGIGYDSTGTSGDLNDLWKFDGTNWTWVSGSNIINQNGTYGTIGQPNIGNVPGARGSAVSWIDSKDNFWLFGGYGYDSTNNYANYLNDLWKFDGTYWTWVSGSNINEQSGSYGTPGVPAASNVPGYRLCSVSWIDSKDNLWLFGGFGSGWRNDLWKFDGTYWTWVSGSSAFNQKGNYGTPGVAAASNVPGAREYSVSWIDSNNNLWLFGGYGYDSTGVGYGFLNDLWKFDGTYWTWVSGSNTSSQIGNYGTLGVAAQTNVPGGRSYPVSWIDSNNNLWLFGGDGYDSKGTSGYLNDLWKFDGTNWTWMGGSTTVNLDGNYGTRSVAAASNIPGARETAVSWRDSNNNFWLFGGAAQDATLTQFKMNDLWLYHPWP